MEQETLKNEVCKTKKRNSFNKNRKRSKEFVSKIDSTKSKPWNNSPEWYKRYPELLLGAANIANNYVPGILRKVSSEHGTLPLSQVMGLSVPVVFTPGKCANPTDGFNMQMKALWIELHRRYRGIGTYEYSDLAIAIFAITHLYAFIAEGERVYGIVRNYKARNRHMPAGMTALLHWDFTSLEKTLADFRYKLNILITKAQVLCLPKGFAMFDDVIQLFSNVFKDRDGVKSQYFAFYNAATWTYNPNQFATGGAVTSGIRTLYWTSTSYLEQLESMINALVGDDDVARICSDLLAAYSDSELIKLQLLPEDYLVEPIYDEFRSLQLHNLTCISDIAAAKDQSVVATWPSGTDLAVYQVDGNVFSVFSGGSGQALSAYYPPVEGAKVSYKGFTTGTLPARTGQLTGLVCDTWHTEFTPEEIAEITRFHVIMRREEVVNSDSTHEFINYLAHGSYIPLIPQLVVLSGSFEDNIMTYESFNVNFYIDDVDGPDTSNIVKVMFMSQIDNSPIFYFVDAGVISSYNSIDIVADIDNIIQISENDLQDIHNVCVLSEWFFDHTIVK